MTSRGRSVASHHEPVLDPRAQLPSGHDIAFPVREHACGNGLRALLLETHTAPVLCVSIWYRVGSSDDPAGGTGMAHLLEHMMFKGSRNFPKGAYDQQLHVLGAMNNASTWLDRTNYYVLIGSDRYETALALEADRLRGAILSAEDLADERTVVLNELDQSRDDPATLLYEELLANAFERHPYRCPVIGWRPDVERISIEDLRAFYDRFYQPANAFLVIAGDFDSERMIADIERHFGRIEGSAVERDARPLEPAPAGPRRFRVSRTGGQEMLALGYPAAQRSAPEALHLDVLAQVLGHGRTSRLYRALIDSHRAVHVAAENQSMPTDPFLFMVDLEPAPGVPVEEILRVYDEEVERLAREPLTEQEFDRARKRARVEFVMRRDRVSALAFLLGEFEIAGGWQQLPTYLERLDAVTSEDVMRAAGRYLRADMRTLGHYVPGEGEVS